MNSLSCDLKCPCFHFVLSHLLNKVKSLWMFSGESFFYQSLFLVGYQYTYSWLQFLGLCLTDLTLPFVPCRPFKDLQVERELRNRWSSLTAGCTQDLCPRRPRWSWLYCGPRVCRQADATTATPTITGKVSQGKSINRNSYLKLVTVCQDKKGNGDFKWTGFWTESNKVSLFANTSLSSHLISTFSIPASTMFSLVKPVL